MIHLFCLLFFFSTSFGASPLEIQALVDLYNSCNGPQWTNRDGWSPTGSGDPCGAFPWYGVSCDGNPKYINIVKLYDNNLIGQIPTSIVNLGSLTILDLSFNAIIGTVPEAVYSMTSLVQLQLNLNNITGTISSSIGNLQKLSILDLGQNLLHGSIPESLYSISTFTQVAFTGNQLTGTISNSIGNLKNLHLFLVGSNKLSGTIPANLGNIPGLVSVQFTTNALTGTIPSSLCSLSTLTGLWLDDNKVRGGGLTGTIPPCFGNLSNLVNLFLSGNKLTGGVPSGLGQLTNLQQLFLGDNLLGGTIPPQLGQLAVNLTHLDIGQANIGGSIPTEIGQLTNLQYLNLATNQLTGTIPDSIENLVNLQQLLLQATYGSANKLTGTVPAGIFGFQQLNLLMLANNKFSGSLPSDTQGFSLSNLQQLDLTSSGLGGPLPRQLFLNSGLTLLLLANNKFEGSLDLLQFFTQQQFIQLALNDNLFSGFVPNFFLNSSFGNPAGSVLKNNPLLCPLPPWAKQTTGASCVEWQITSLTPPYADTFYSTPIGINGSNFQNLGVYCYFDNSASSAATYVSSTYLTCTAPTTANVTRTLNFSLTYQNQPLGLSTAPTFVYLGIPEIESISPNSGREQGYVTVTITGSNFYGLPNLNLLSCLFGDTFVPATYVDPTQVVCVTPPNIPGDVSISVSIDGNHSIGNTDILFTYFEYCDGLPEACMGNGICNTIPSPPICMCNTNYKGVICGECEDLYYGPDCLQCPDCGSNGTCNATLVGDGLCICEAGFYGTNCNPCPACVNGKCSDGQRGNGKCTCDTLWGGDLCDSYWKVYVIAIVPGATIIIIIIIVVIVVYRRRNREYKKLAQLSTGEFGN